jgi:16S rRNA A1518/A1519 N6-dimethyltransferase RsmA/KsgA/DIM1 with predicted DNA glycosylase/AP lyase activity
VEPWTAFTAFVQQVFGRRRKQLGAILGRDAVTTTGIDPMRRPETLTPEEWIRLHAALGSATPSA